MSVSLNAYTGACSRGGVWASFWLIQHPSLRYPPFVSNSVRKHLLLSMKFHEILIVLESIQLVSSHSAEDLELEAIPAFPCAAACVT